jgi:hypothetical protein
MADQTCPHCEARLRNVQAGADGFVRCLNCGKRFRVAAVVAEPVPVAFAPEPTPDTAPPPSPAPATSATPTTGLNGAKAPLAQPVPPAAHDPHGPLLPLAPMTDREPPAASYGLVVALGYVLLVGAALGGISILVAVIATFMTRYGSRGEEATMLFLVGCAVLLGGPILLILTYQFARLDRAAGRILWRCGALSEPLPRPPGSSLPYILPLTVIGGLTIIAPAVIAGEEPDVLLVGLVSLPYGVVLALTGLCLGEVRRFLWRFDQMGQALARKARASSETLHVPAPGLNYSPLLLLGAMVLTTLCFLCAVSEMTPRRAEDRLFIVFAILGIMSGSISLFLLSWQTNRAVRSWEHALRLWRQLRGPRGSNLRSEFPALLLVIFPWLWAALMVVAFLVILAEDWRYNYPLGPQEITAFVAALFAVCAGVLAAGWSGETLRQLNRAARIAEAFEEGTRPVRPSTGTVRANFGLPENLLGTCVFMLFLILVAIFLIVLCSVWGSSKWGMILLVTSAPMYAGLWLAMFAAYTNRAAIALEAAGKDRA